MSNRNSLFRKAKQILENEGHSEDKATAMAYNSLIQSREQDHIIKYTGSGETPGSSPIAIVEDMCLETLLGTLNCTEDEFNPFRRLNGMCNNVGFTTSTGRKSMELMWAFNIVIAYI